MNKPTRIEIVRAACEKFKDTPSRTIARVIYKENRALFNSLENCYQSVRFARGNHGKENRRTCNLKEIHRPNGKAEFVWKFPTSHAPSYAPFILDSERTLILSDLHIPFHDTAAIMAAIEFAACKTASSKKSASAFMPRATTSA